MSRKFVNEYNQQVKLSLPIKLREPPPYPEEGSYPQVAEYNEALDNWKERQAKPITPEEILEHEGTPIEFLHSDLNKKLQWLIDGVRMWKQLIETYDSVYDGLRDAQREYETAQKNANRNLVAALNANKVQTTGTVRAEGDFTQVLREIKSWINTYQRARFQVDWEQWRDMLVQVFEEEMSFPLVERQERTGSVLKSYSVGTKVHAST